MAANLPDSFFAKQGSTQEEAGHNEPEPVYLSPDSEEELSYVEGSKPGIPLALLAIPEHLRNVYKFSEDAETRKKELETFKMLDSITVESVESVKEDRKCSPPSSPDPKPTKKPRYTLKISDKDKKKEKNRGWKEIWCMG
jgi:hypothetical protein